MWKAVFNCLNIDKQIWKIGIPLVSCCNRSVEGHIEDLEHVLSSGKFEREVWKNVSAEIGVPFLPQQRWRERVQAWLNRASQQA